VVDQPKLWLVPMRTPPEEKFIEFDEAGMMSTLAAVTATFDTPPTTKASVSAPESCASPVLVSPET
jgi:hypothetical protein